MIISPGRNYIFVHVPKTGGTALSLALEARAMKDDILIGDTPKAKQRKRRLKGVRTAGKLWKHSTLADIDGLVSPEELDDMLLFTLVRNPWDRMVSYYHWLTAQGFDHPVVALSKETDFAGFIAHPMIRASLRGWPCRSYMRDSRGLQRPALYIRLENLREDIEPLERHLGFRLDDIPHANRSERRPDYRSYFTDDSAQLIADMCREDITQFGYSF